jgi:hypothetical protein
MELKEKIEEILRLNELKTKKELATILKIEYNIFNRNVKANNLTGDMIKAFVNSENLLYDLKKLVMVKEEAIDPIKKITYARALLAEAISELTREEHV